MLKKFALHAKVPFLNAFNSKPAPTTEQKAAASPLHWPLVLQSVQMEAPNGAFFPDGHNAQSDPLGTVPGGQVRQEEEPWVLV